MESIKGKTCVITGASSGIGRASAYALADQGVNLVLTARREERLRVVCAECEKKGVKAVYYAGDATDEKTAEKTVKLAIETFGRIDMFLSNAGIGIYKPFLKYLRGHIITREWTKMHLQSLSTRSLCTREMR